MERLCRFFSNNAPFLTQSQNRTIQKIRNSLKSDGMYIECDYMVESQEEEDFYYAENHRIRTEMGLSEEEFYHYDTPCTIQNQIMMFKKAGFSKCDLVFRIENTTIIIAYV